MNFQESLRSSILCIERVVGERRAHYNKIQHANRLNDLDIIYDKYTQVLEDIENKAEIKFEQYNRQKVWLILAFLGHINKEK